MPWCFRPWSSTSAEKPCRHISKQLADIPRSHSGFIQIAGRKDVEGRYVKRLSFFLVMFGCIKYIRFSHIYIYLYKYIYIYIYIYTIIYIHKIYIFIYICGLRGLSGTVVRLYIYMYVYIHITIRNSPFFDIFQARWLVKPRIGQIDCMFSTSFCTRYCWSGGQKRFVKRRCSGQVAGCGCCREQCFRRCFSEPGPASTKWTTMWNQRRRGGQNKIRKRETETWPGQLLFTSIHICSSIPPFFPTTLDFFMLFFATQYHWWLCECVHQKRHPGLHFFLGVAAFKLQ